MRQPKTASKRRYLTLGIVVLLIALMAGVFAQRHYSQQKQLPAAVTTSKSKTAQSNYSQGAPRASNSSGNTNDGGIVDKKGAVDGSTLPGAGAWTSSNSGAVTLQQPVSNAIVRSGDTLSGTATVSTVQYRIVDDKLGVIGQGSLSVVNGKFSGTLQFTSSHTTGSINIFSYDKDSGAEINSAKILVKFE